MANDLTTLAVDLKRIEDAAALAEQEIAKLRQQLEALLKQSSRGGVPTPQGISRLAGGILTGQTDPFQRNRMENESRTSAAFLKQNADKVTELVTKYQALTKAVQEYNQAASSIRMTMFNNPRVSKGIEAAGLVGDITEEDAIAMQQAKAAAGPVVGTGAKAAKTQTADIERQATAFNKFYQSMASFIQLQKRFPEAIDTIRMAVNYLGGDFDNLSMRVTKLPGGFEKLTASVKAAGVSLGPYKFYVDDAGNALTELEVKQKQAIATQQKYTTSMLQAEMGTMRYQQANKMASRYGFGPGELTTMRTQQPSGVTFLRYEKINELTGGVNRLDVAVDRVGRTVNTTNRRFLDFFSAIAKNTAEVIRWSIGATAVYSALFKLQDLVRMAIENEAKLADVTITLGNNQRDVNDIFADAAKVANETGENLSGVIDAYVMTYRAVGSIEDPIKRTAAANKLLTDSIILAKLSALDQAQSIDVLAGAIRQLQQPNESFDQALERGTKLLDQWIAVTRKANVDLATIATAFSITAESADNAGVSTEELTAIIASLSEKIGGLGGRETGNAVRAIIGGVYQGQAAEALGRYGVAITDVNGKMRDFLDIMREVASLRDQQLISSDQLNKLGYVLGGGVRRGQQYIAFLDDLQRIDQIVAYQTNVQGNAQEALGKKLDTVQTSVTRLSNSFQNLAQALGERGGVLDAANGVLSVLTALNNIVATITRTFGRITIPAALLALAGFYFRGPQGALKGQEYRLGVASTFGGLASGALGFIPGMGQPKQQPGMMFAPQAMMMGGAQGGPTQAQALGTRFGTWMGQMGPALLIGMMPAISRMGQELTKEEKWKAVAIDLVGGITGGLVGGPIGAIIGSSIADSFVSAIVDYKPTLQDFFRDIFPEKVETDVTNKEGKTPEEQYQDLQKEIFQQAGGGIGLFPKEDLGKVGAVIGASFLNTASRIRETLGLGGFGQYTPAQVALLRATPEQRTRLGQLYKETPQPTVTAQPTIATEEEKRIAKEIQQRSTQAQLQRLYAREIKPAEYLKTQQEIQGFLALLPQLQRDFGATFDQISDDISGSQEVFQAFADVIIQGSDEDMSYIKSLAGEIEDMKATIEEANKAGRDTITVLDDLGRESYISIADYTDQMNTKVQNVAQTFAALRREQQIQQTILPQNIQLEIRPQDLDKVLTEAKRLEGLYLAALTPEEREKYLAEQQVANYLIEMWAKGGQIAYQEISKMKLGVAPPGAGFITQAAQGLIGQGQIPQAGKGVGFEQFNVTYSQFAKAMERYGTLMGQLTQAGYQPDEQYQIAVFQDGIIRPMSKDWKIVQMLLQDILDTSKDQLEGIYNLPEGASFYVPFQGYKLGFGQGGGGMGNIDWNAIPGDMSNATELGAKEGTFQGVVDGFAKLGYQFFGPNAPEGFVQPSTAPGGTMGWDKAVQSLIARGATQYQFPNETTVTRPPATWPPVPPAGVKAMEYQQTPKPGPVDIVGVLSTLNTNLSTVLETKLQAFVDAIGNIPDALGRIFGIPQNQTNKNLFPTTKGAETAPVLNSIFLANKNLPKVETKLSLNINSNIQLMVDGRMLAAIIKQYLYEDLIRSEGVAGSINRTIVI